MVLQLIRKEKRPDGIFSELLDSRFNFLFMCLEHAYKQEDGSYQPKLKAGEYVCQLGEHMLADMKPFMTYEILGVEGHWGILFHVGNYNEDSEGCVLVGKGYGYKSDMKGKMIVNSRVAFAEFMKLLNGDKTFVLKVEDQI